MCLPFFLKTELHPPQKYDKIGKNEKGWFSMKIGILGAGNISRKVAPALVALPEIECCAVASRELAKAEAFAREFGFAKA